MVCQLWVAVPPLAACPVFCHDAVYLNQRVFLCDTYVTFASRDERGRSRVHYLLNKLGTTGLFNSQETKTLARPVLAEKVRWQEPDFNAHAHSRTHIF
jgi:hypothetical protein